MARNAFDAYLIISADAGSVTSIGALSDAVELADPHRDRGVVAADHDAVRVQEVADRRCPRGGTRGSTRPRPRSIAAPASREDALHEAGRADRHRRLVDHDRARPQHRRDLAGDGLDEREVGRAVVALRRRHAEEDELGGRRGVRGADDERAAAATRGPRSTSSGSPSSRIGISPLDERSDPLHVDVGADDPVAQVGEAGGGGQTRRSPAPMTATSLICPLLVLRTGPLGPRSAGRSAASVRDPRCAQ